MLKKWNGNSNNNEDIKVNNKRSTYFIVYIWKLLLTFLHLRDYNFDLYNFDNSVLANYNKVEETVLEISYNLDNYN